MTADIALIVFPGTNREHDMAAALASAGGRPRMVWHKETNIGAPDLIVLPGGFSYGDYLRCGAMAAHSPVMREVISKAKAGTPLLGVCNGFQMLVETGLLPGALLRNRKLKFICRQTYLRCETNDTPFTSRLSKGDLIHVPVAHGEGGYTATPDMVSELEDKDCIAFRYCNDNGDLSEDSNPNGSTDHIAGVYNDRKTILGMMPHPENATQAWQANQSGTPIFEGLLQQLTR